MPPPVNKKTHQNHFHQRRPAPNGTSGKTFNEGDANFDGVVDGSDFDICNDAVGETGTAVQSATSLLTDSSTDQTTIYGLTIADRERRLTVFPGQKVIVTRAEMLITWT